MKLFEYQAQNLLKDYGINVPGGVLAQSADEACQIAAKTAGRSAVKAQVLTGGRGKAGGIKVVSSAEEARAAAGRILGLTIKGEPVNKVLVTPAVDIKKEFYVSIVLNRGQKRIDGIFCAEGGIEIEEIAVRQPEKIHTLPLNPDIFAGGLKRRMAQIFKDGPADQFTAVIEKMFRLFTEKDCSLVEINPLVLDGSGKLTALDAKIVIDDNSLFKHPDLAALKNPEESSRDETDAKKAGLAFVSLDGNIGCMVNGAGLAMATMDLIKHFGAEPANFLDIGGSSNPQKVVDGFSILLRNPNVKAILLNIFGGITRCDDIARGLIEAGRQLKIPVPLVVRLIGTNDGEGRALLKEAGFTVFSELAEAVRQAVQKTKGAL